MKIAITGGAGFIGSNFVHHMVEHHPDYELSIIDKLTYAGNLENLSGVLSNPRVRFVRIDICDPQIVDLLRGCDAVVHFAAESHVDRSIEDAAPFIRTNVEGTQRIIEASRQVGVSRFLQVSTDEVYGSLTLASGTKFTETSPLNPTSPYAASKAAADLVVMSYFKTHGFPAIITRCSNNYGPYQFPEKFIPLMIAQAMDGQPLPVYGDGMNVRDWIHVSDHCRALDLILHKGSIGEIYNVGGDCELPNLAVIRTVLARLSRAETLIQFVTDRLAHDRRYALDFGKLSLRLKWEPSIRFEEGLSSTITWYHNNRAWLERARSGRYRDYFDRHYGAGASLVAGPESALAPN